MWTHINYHSEKFKNPFYNAGANKRIEKIPVTNYFQLKLWNEFFFRYSDLPAYNMSEAKSPEEHRDMLMK